MSILRAITVKTSLLFLSTLAAMLAACRNSPYPIGAEKENTLFNSYD